MFIPAFKNQAHRRSAARSAFHFHFAVVLPDQPVYDRQTEADAGSGWWTKDGDNYYFKWGAVFAEQADGGYQLKDGGVFDYTIAFLSSDGSQDNVAATYTFQIDLSGYTITADE